MMKLKLDTNIEKELKNMGLIDKKVKEHQKILILINNCFKYGCISIKKKNRVLRLLQKEIRNYISKEQERNRSEIKNDKKIRECS